MEIVRSSGENTTPLNGVFVNLHSHSESSRLDSIVKVPDLVDKAVALGSPGVAISDHGNMGSMYRLHKETQRYKAMGIPIKPLYGCEFYFVEDKDNRDDRKYNHLTIYAMNKQGLNNIMYLTSASYLHGMYGKPRIDWDLLKRHSEGLLGLSGCCIGRVPELLLKGEELKAMEALQKFKSVFHENFFLEIQPTPLDFQIKLNHLILDLGEKTDTPVVITTDSHYLDKQDFDLHEAMLCIQTQSVLSNPERFSFDCPEFYYADALDIQERVDVGQHESVKESLQTCFANTLKVVELCNVELETTELYFPKFPIPEKEEEFLTYWSRVKQGNLV